MEIGIHLVATGDLYRVAERYTKLLDRLSPDCIWLSDRLLVDDLRDLAGYCGESADAWEKPPEFLDPFVTAAALVQYMPQPTRFGIAATDFIRRAAPDLARAAYTLNQVLPAPLNIGFGAGEAINLTPFGYVQGLRPVSHFEEGLRQFRQINDRGQFPGNTLVELGYCQHPSSIWVAGQRPRMLRLTAIHADGWLPAWKMSSEQYRYCVMSLRAMAAEAKRSSPTLGLFAMPVMGPSKRVLLEYFRGSPMARAVAFMASNDVWEKWGLEHPAGKNSKGLFDTVLRETSTAALHRSLLAVPAEMIDEILFIGNTQELLDEFWQFKLAGLQHLSLLLPDFTDKRISYGLANFDAEFFRLCREIQSW